MIITCPHCQTRYQVAAEAIGAVGRKVQCAHCQQAWQAAPQRPEPLRPALVADRASQPSGDEVIMSDPSQDDTLFQDIAELGLDQAFIAEEQAVLAEKKAETVSETKALSEADKALSRKRQRAFFTRQQKMADKLPHARVRRTARALALAALIFMLGSGLMFRTPIVSHFPALAGLYASLGMPVNVVGLDFRNVRTLRTARSGVEILQVNALITSASDRMVAVPPVVVTLLNGEGVPVYEWSVAGQARDLAPGETSEFATEVTSPPIGVETVRLTFSGAANAGASTMSAEVR